MNKSTKRTTRIGLLMALVIVLQFVSGMIPPIAGFSISLVLIPIVLGAAIYGPKVGMLLGGTFGIIVIINCMTGVDIGGQMVYQANPLICILVVLTKGILAGGGAGLVYLLFKEKNSHFAMLCSAIICPVLNTGIFVSCMLVFFPDVLSVWAGGGDIVKYVLTGLVVANFIPELLINIVFSPFGVDLAKRAIQ